MLFAESVRNKSLIAEVSANLGICYNLINDTLNAEVLKKAAVLMDEVSEVRVTYETIKVSNTHDSITKTLRQTMALLPC
jgi:hypothetical protein